VNEECDFGVKFAESGECGKWNSNQISDATDIENDLIGTFFEEAAAEKSDHEEKYCRLFFACQRAAGTVVRLSGDRRASRPFQMIN
jgi:hypothetical protein